MFKDTRFYAALLFAVAFNAIPFWGVTYNGWNLFMLVSLYWLETIVSGAFSYLRIRRAEGKEDFAMVKNKPKLKIMQDFLFWNIVFFLFASVFLLLMIYPNDKDIASLHSPSFLLAIIAMFLEHVYAHYLYIAHSVYKTTSAYKAQGSTMGRVILLFLVAWAGGVLGGFEFPGIILGSFVLLKTLGDIFDVFNKVLEKKTGLGRIFSKNALD